MIWAARRLLALGLLACASGSAAHPPVTSAHFVGCPAGGQTGPRPAPSSGRVPNIMASLAGRVAYYSAGNEGVLAPRGWHCAELSGSNGTILIVTPELHDPESLLRGDRPLRGPGVVLVIRYGGTSGRWEVAAMISRMFPQHRAFLRRFDELGLTLGDMPSGPYPDDVIRRTTETWLEFTTPAGRNGLGTDGFLAPGAGQVEGLVMLLPEDEMTMVELDVRLPVGDADLAHWIISAVRHDHGDDSP